MSVSHPQLRTILFACVIISGTGLFSSAYAANDYTNSAHGDNSIGVLRTSAELTSSTRGNNYARGNCAHCHEQHASIDGVQPAPDGGNPSNFALFADTNPNSQNANFCFNCHQTFGSLQTGGITNNDYSTTFGGQAVASTTSVADAFNPVAGTAHDLTDILTELTTSFAFAATDNPCGGCHNPHLARKNNVIGAAYNPANAAISRPGNRNVLWGPLLTERMQAHAGGFPAGAYRSPFVVGANPAVPVTTHEPDGLAGSVAAASPNVIGTLTPDYSTFCLDCHNRPLAGTNPGRGIPAIPWAVGDGRSQHGPAIANGAANAGNRIAPYTVDGSNGTGEDLAVNFVLSCLDCHEAHGSQQVNGQYLLRTTVNGTATVLGAAPGLWYNFCITCHTIAGGGGTPHVVGINPATNCAGAACHGHGGAVQNF